jgi:hypothetical protein
MLGFSVVGSEEGVESYVRKERCEKKGRTQGASVDGWVCGAAGN